MSLDLATEQTHGLLRTALLAKLAVDLQDPALARRAARDALAHARMLSGLGFPPDPEDGSHCGLQPVDLGALLARLYPSGLSCAADVGREPDEDAGDEQPDGEPAGAPRLTEIGDLVLVESLERPPSQAPAGLRPVIGRRTSRTPSQMPLSSSSAEMQDRAMTRPVLMPGP